MKNFLLFLLLIGFSLSAQEYEYVNISDGSIAYKTFGKGFPVLIINGGPGIGSDGFSSLAEVLSVNNQTIIYDQRGTGRSQIDEINASSMSMDHLLTDIESLRKHLGFDEWIVLGHSFGGMLAYAYATEYPERVTGMIQSHSGGLDLDIRNAYDLMSRLSDTERDSLTHYSVKIRMGDDSPETSLRRATILASAYLFDKSFAPQVAGRLSSTDMRINSLIWNELESIDFNTSEEMRNFEKPVLILTGEDEVAPVFLAEKAHSILPNSELVIMERCGHYGWLERPDIYLTKVNEFLNKNSKSKDEYH
jgi:proline iminopeptidase